MGDRGVCHILPVRWWVGSVEGVEAPGSVEPGRIGRLRERLGTDRREVE